MISRAATVVGLVLLVAPTAATAQQGPLDLRVFAPVPAPGQPEGLVVAPDGDVYATSFNNGKGDASRPGTIFRFAPDGILRRTYAITGEDMTAGLQGAGGIAFDANGLMYVVDGRPARVLTIDPATGTQRTYSDFRSLPSCPSTGSDGSCTAAPTTSDPKPVSLLFDAHGTLYVSDLQQAAIWRIAPGGGRPSVWFTDPRLAGPFGINKLRLAPNRWDLLFTQSASTSEGLTTPGAGAVVLLRRNPDGAPGPLTQIWESQVGEGPDGLAVAASGNLYVSLSSGNQVVRLDPIGRETGRAPDPVSNALATPAVDGPSTATFLGTRVLVANQSFLTGNASNWAILQIDTGEDGVAPHLPFERPTSDARCARVITLRIPRRRGRSVRVVLLRTGARARVIRGRDLRHIRVARPTRGRRSVRLRITYSDGVTRTTTTAIRACPS